MNVLFVDHSFHEKTTSTLFLKELLEAHFHVSALYIDPESALPDLAKLVPAPTEIVVIVQLDYLAPIFIAMGLRVVVIPMYDGSAHMPDLHWLMCREARFVNFSRRLHYKISRCGTSSMLVKYFKPPVAECELKSFDTLRVLLWQRRPEEGINLRMVEKLLGQQVESIHVHDSADDPNLDTAEYLISTVPEVGVTTSRWFTSSAGYAKLLEESNVFIAPRLAEGIGMSVLEAMSRGMLVIAADDATHNEYLSNWVNGILFNPNAATYADLHGRAEAIGRMAWRTTQIGYEYWLACVPKLVEYIAETPQPSKGRTHCTPDWAEALVAHYFEGMGIYNNFLQRSTSLVEQLANSPIREFIDAVGQYDPSIQHHPLHRMLVSATQHFPRLDQNRFVASVSNSSRYIVEGRANFERDCAWMLDDGMTLGFSIDPDVGVTDYLELHYQRAVLVGDQQSYLLILNGYSIGGGVFPDLNGMRRHKIPPGALQRTNLFRIQLSNEGSPTSGSGHKQAFGLARIAFV